MADCSAAPMLGRHRPSHPEQQRVCDRHLAGTAARDLGAYAQLMRVEPVGTWPNRPQVQQRGFEGISQVLHKRHCPGTRVMRRAAVGLVGSPLSPLARLKSMPLTCTCVGQCSARNRGTHRGHTCGRTGVLVHGTTVGSAAARKHVDGRGLLLGGLLPHCASPATGTARGQPLPASRASGWGRGPHGRESARESAALACRRLRGRSHAPSSLCREDCAPVCCWHLGAIEQAPQTAPRASPHSTPRPTARLRRAAHSTTSGAMAASPTWLEWLAGLLLGPQAIRPGTHQAVLEEYRARVSCAKRSPNPLGRETRSWCTS